MKNKTFLIGDMQITVECIPLEGEYLDSRVFINGKCVFWISWAEMDEFKKRIESLAELAI